MKNKTILLTAILTLSVFTSGCTISFGTNDADLTNNPVSKYAKALCRNDYKTIDKFIKEKNYINELPKEISPDDQSTGTLEFICNNSDSMLVKETAEYLLEKGADPNYRNKRGISVFDIMAANGQFAYADLLLKYGAKPDSSKGIASLEYLTSNIEMLDEADLKRSVLYLKEHGAKITEKARKNAVKLARKEGYYAAGAPLADDKIIEEQDDEIKLYFYAALGNVEGIKTLEASGVDAKKVNLNEDTILSIAAKSNRPEVIKLSLNKGIDINMENGDANTPLMEAVMFNSEEAAGYLLKRGAKIQTWKDEPGDEDDRYDMPDTMSEAVLINNVSMVKLLIKQGYKLEDENIVRILTDSYDFLPGTETAEYLVSQMKNINTDYKGVTLLDGAVTSMPAQYIEMILKKGIKPETESEFNNGNLYWALLSGRSDVAKLLIKYGSDPEPILKNGDKDMKKQLKEITEEK